MKKMIEYFVILTVAVTTALSCTKSNTEISGEGRTVRFTSAASETKTVFGNKNAETGNYPVLWTADQKVALFYNSQTGISSEGYGGAQYVTPVPSPDGLTAEFSATFTKEETASHSFYAFSPLCALNGMLNENWGTVIKKALYANIPADQVPVPGTCDETAQLIVAHAEYDTFPEKVELSFSHLSAYGKIKELSLPEGAKDIVGVTIQSNKVLSGEIYYYYDEPGKVNVNYQKEVDLYTKVFPYIYLNVNNAHRGTSLKDVFFATVPVSFGKGDWLKIKVHTISDTWVKTINFTSDKQLEFNPGQISSFSVSAEVFAK